MDRQATTHRTTPRKTRTREISMDTKKEATNKAQGPNPSRQRCRLSLRSLIGMLCGLLSVAALAADPGWTVTPGLENTMTVHAVVLKPDGTYLSLPSLSKLAAFKGAECRGVCTIFNGPATQDQFQLSAGALTTGVPAADLRGFTLKVWDAGTDTVSDILEGFDFVANTTLGTVVNPLVYHMLAPALTVQALPPAADPVAVAEGGTSSFSVTVSGGYAPYTYAWTVAGAAAGGNASTFDYQPDFAAVTHPNTSAAKLVVCTVTDAGGTPSVVATTWTSVTVTDVDRLPTAPVIAISPAAPTTANALSVSYPTPSTDADGDAIIYDIVWTHGATTVTTPTLPAAQTHEGETWSLSVRAQTLPYGTAVFSAADTDSVVILNTPPVANDQGGAAGLPLTAGSTLDVTLTGTDPDLPAPNGDGTDVLTFALASTTTAEGGTLTLLNPATGYVKYTPPAAVPPATAWVGTDTFQFTAADEAGASAPGTVKVQVFEAFTFVIDVAGGSVDLDPATAGLQGLELGTAGGATEAADPGIDILAPPPADGIGYARLTAPAHPGDAWLIKDKRAAIAGARFLIEVRAGAVDPVVLSWNGAGLPADQNWHLWQVPSLNDLAPIPGTAIDMATVTATVPVPADPWGTNEPVYFMVGTPGAITVTTVAPGTGLPAGYTPLTVGGTGFLAGAVVTFDGLPATLVTVAAPVAPATTSVSLTARTPAHGYARTAVVVTNPDGGVGTLPAAFLFNAPPTANAGGPYTMDSGAGLPVNASASTAPAADAAAGDALAYRWDLDGVAGFEYVAAGPTSTIPWTALSGLTLGTPHTIRLQVTDQGTLTATASTTLTIYDNSPTAAFSITPASATVTASQVIRFNPAASAHASPLHHLVTYDWDFNYDGSTFDVMATQPTPVVVAYVYNLLSAGTYRVALRVTDSNTPAKTALIEHTVTVLNTPPTAEANGPYSIDVTTPLQLSGSGTDADAGQTLTYAWDLDGDGFDDGDGSAPVSWATLAALGLPENVANPIRLKVTDGHGGEAIDSTTLTLVNDSSGNPSGWMFTFDVFNGSAAQLRIGVNPDATDGYDVAFDQLAVPETPAPGAPFSAIHAVGSPVRMLKHAVNDIGTDVNGDGVADTYADWLVELKAGSGLPLVVLWDSSEVPSPGGMALVEVDAQDRPLPGTPRVDMSSTDTIIIPIGGHKFYRVIYGFYNSLEFQLTLAQGWNLFSLPIEPADPDAATLLVDAMGPVFFPNSLYSYTAGGTYEAETTLQALTGYWVYALRDAVITVRGLRSSRASQPLAVAGWHLVTVAQAGVLVNPGSHDLFLPGYGWDPLSQQYFLVDEGEVLDPGFAYWVYANVATQWNPYP